MNLIVTMKAESLLARLAGTHDRLMDSLRITVQRLAIKAQGVVKNDKLTGQVLHVRSGTLRRSINQKVEVSDTGVIATVGTNVKYAARFEYGFQGVENVRAHVRRAATSSSFGGAFGKAGKGSIQVRAFTRNVNQPKRSFLVSTLQDMQSEIQTSLRATILQGVRP